ncbi:hypothetical protein JAAARDRAFT_37957 [Jaapia argillacea MUCL 33604]|uniref:RNA-binding domain-containing protein n=1 Tax=Jaapia argillacea MUCL 33604 TaxID=933084 RepID=A0A067PIW0_9AGAM|nr:hypothetical protein JAAARDRAFT_37957 [Jaapia argillacea MUCL 33604]
MAEDAGNPHPEDKWGPSEHDSMGPSGEASNGGPPPSDDPSAQDSAHPDYPRGVSEMDGSATGGKTASERERRDKQVKPNKVYIGGLPEHTRREDLQSCFGKIGTIVNIELKLGYGFVVGVFLSFGCLSLKFEFESKEAAEESVAKYHEGYFMGNKIRVELSHGGGRTAKYAGEPGACFKCGQMGHWARECPNHGASSGGGGRRDAPLIDRIQPSRDFPPPPPREYGSYREDYGRFPPRDPRYYDYPPIPPPGRDYRRPPSPPRDFREYPVGPPPPMRSARDYDDYRMRGGPPPPPPPPRYESRPGYYPPDDLPPPPGYPPRGYAPPPPPRDFYDRYDRKPLPPPDRYGAYPPPPGGGRPRSPPPGVPPPRGRDEFDRPPRDYLPPPPEFRGRPPSPPSSRYPDYPPPRAPSTDAPTQRYRRRSQSPPSRSAPGTAGYDTYSGNGYPGNGSASVPPPRSAGPPRDYPPRNGRESGDPSGSYRRA